MLKILRSPETHRMASALLVILIAGVIGHKAGQGMDLQQWLGAAVAVIGSIIVAALVHTSPEPAPEEAQVKARRRD